MGLVQISVMADINPALENLELHEFDGAMYVKVEDFLSVFTAVEPIGTDESAND